MNVLVYNQIDTGKVKPQFERVSRQLAEGNFRAADVRKMQNTGFYRAKLNDADRLLFKIGGYQGQRVILLLEVILNHAYDHSRFLRGASVDESQFVPLDSPEAVSKDSDEPLVYVNRDIPRFHVLDRIISFDDHQMDAFSQRLPLILIGSAGSGKTVLVMEKLKETRGDVLYVTRSPHLAEHARRLYYALNYENDGQQITFASFHEFLEMIRIPEGRPVDFKMFSAWYARHRAQYPFRNPHMLFEEFGGVLTGATLDGPCMSRDAYLELGVRRSIFEASERPLVYDLFEKYVAALPKEGRYEPNILSWEYRSLCRPAYDFVAVDEIQDLTNAQMALILKALRQEDQFILCGDSNQIVHPNFFSWTGLKAMFYNRSAERAVEVFRVLNQNYRNAAPVVEIANRLLRLKVARFGSIDRESNYLVKSVSPRDGDVELVADKEASNCGLNEKTRRSVRYAVLTLREEDKAAARRYFETPLVFSIQEAKGLEYDNIILFNFVSGCRREFEDIAQGVDPQALQGELDYARAKDKTDKSLEVYKFYVNALYVGLTRAITRVIWIEGDIRHRLFQLLALAPREQAGGVNSETSSDDAWREEASRLERKGNVEQAEQIRRQVLRQQNVPWTVWTPANIDDLKKQALDPASFNKQAKKQLFEYAVVYGEKAVLDRLVELKFNRARTETDAAHVNAEYGRVLEGREFPMLRRQVALYGVDYRNPLNQTPLMIAARVGRLDAVEWLIREGASLEEADNSNLPVFWQVMMPSDPAVRENRSPATVARLCDLIAPPSLSIQADRRLIKLDIHQFDYWLLLVMVLHHRLRACEPLQGNRGAYNARQFVDSQRLVELVSVFPETVMPLRRKRRPYCSSALARCEVFSNAPYNRMVVYRFATGFYMVNPMLKILVNGQWVPVYTMLGGPMAEFAQRHAKTLTAGQPDAS